MKKFFVWSQASLVLLTVLAGCGSDSGASGPPTTADLVASCKKSCNKFASCQPDSGGFAPNCDSLCSDQTFQMGSVGQSSAPACDYGKVKAKLDECATVDCSKLLACQQEAAAICPASPQGSGAASGAGGSSSGAGGLGAGTGGVNSGGGAPGGSSGAAGAGTCADCDKANVCCKSLQDPAICDPASFSKASCDTSGQEMAAIIVACGGVAAMCH